ncbi:MAG: CZB domain-containing protein [Sulfuritalea sp.]|nr:CZB domain-containing protein [Sulfuritalea sp.]
MQAFDFDSAQTMHRAWKMRFHLALERVSGKDFDTQPIGDDAQCRLGQWLAANAGELESFASARELHKVHEEFHRRSQAIADDIKNGKILHMGDTAIVDFGVLSAKIETLLQQLDGDLRQSA